MENTQIILVSANYSTFEEKWECLSHWYRSTKLPALQGWHIIPLHMQPMFTPLLSFFPKI